MNYAKHVKKVLLNIVHEMAKVPWLFVQNPGVDFSKERKLPFEKMIQFFLSMESKGLQKELLEFFDFKTDTATTSAFYQQRKKILHEAFEFLFHEFNNSFPHTKTYRGYSLVACDGSGINIPRNPLDSETYIQHSKQSKGFNQLHLTALYDLQDRRYMDVTIQPAKRKNEMRAMTDMVDRYSGNAKTIFISDRGFECYNVFAHVEQKGLYYLIRVKDRYSTGMVSSFSLPDTDEFDHTVSFSLTRKCTKEIKEHPELYKYLRTDSPFDYLDSTEHLFYPISLRVVRIRLENGGYSSLITNLPREEFTVQNIKELYAKRWGIETSFREAKYDVGMDRFHSKKVEYICQEIYARLILYNFCSLITMAVEIKQKDTIWDYQVNYTLSIHLCRHFLKTTNISPPDIEALIRKNLLPVRPGRSAPRKVRAKSAVSFTYRVS